MGRAEEFPFKRTWVVGTLILGVGGEFGECTFPCATENTFLISSQAVSTAPRMTRGQLAEVSRILRRAGRHSARKERPLCGGQKLWN